jgi:hypothetical protein
LFSVSGNVFWRGGDDDNKQRADEAHLRFAHPLGDQLSAYKAFREWQRVMEGWRDGKGAPRDSQEDDDLETIAGMDVGFDDEDAFKDDEGGLFADAVGRAQSVATDADRREDDLDDDDDDDASVGGNSVASASSGAGTAVDVDQQSDLASEDYSDLGSTLTSAETRRLQAACARVRSMPGCSVQCLLS